ncbi:MAG TPA: glycosyltransferase [Chitinophaga sp.]|uniref:glycosyltransferase family 4 protein n=1 Tax=Chitinophaga sp. TaxID=1869181 RepID=UPI002CDE8F5A|nr:glycosyltransferase [Chitinophaga sp.]HVI44633.1 glycosyltransferase [Chitinophaga sp.]
MDTNRFHSFEKPYSHQRTLLFVGRLVPYKGLDVLEQLAAIIEQSDKWRLLIACNETPDTVRFSGLSKTTIKTGLNIDNIAAGAYAAGDLLILPSMFEGFELVTLEALSTGIPVIGTKVGAISELYDQGFPGVHLLPDSISFTDDAILQHFDHLLEAFQQAITPQALHEKVAAKFGMVRYARELDAILAG